MGAHLSQIPQPEELAVFKKLPANTPPENIQIPESPENRRPTDRKCLFTFIIIVILLFPFLIYTMINGDLARFKWYDKCGNICGQKNTKYSQWSCTGQDFTDKPFLQVEETQDSMTKKEAALVERKCVEKCDSGYKQVSYTCYRPENSSGSSNNLSSSDSSEFKRFKRETTDSDINDGDNRVTKFLNKHAWIFVLSTFISIGVAIIILLLFITATTCVVWICLIGVPVLFGVMAGIFIYLCINLDEWNKRRDRIIIKVFCLLFPIGSFCLFCMIAYLFKKIQLVIQLLKESAKAVIAMPLLIFVPIISFFAELIIIGLLIFTNIWMYTSGTLTEIKPGYLEYKSNAVMNFTIFFNAVVATLSLLLVNGIQDMTIAGATATWYWSKTKKNLNSPISRSANIVFRFHLGSIAFGSSIITVFIIIEILIRSLAENEHMKEAIERCMNYIETFLKFLSKNSYIITALHGTPFIKSGKRAATIIYHNLVNIISINFVGSFVLIMVQLSIIIIPVFITAVIIYGEDEDDVFIVCLIVFFVSFLIAGLTFAIFDSLIDTIFICFCEDSLLNDGKAHPYAMSRELMEFIEKSKIIYEHKETN